MKSGVYSITNVITGKSYVGSSIDVDRRFWGHLNGLRKGDHHNILLQRAWNKYGEDAFEFKVIEFCHEDDLPQCEQFWLDVLEVYVPSKGYNLARSVEHTTRGYKWRPESIQRLSTSIRLHHADPGYRIRASEAALALNKRRPELAEQHSARMKGRKPFPLSAEGLERIVASKRGKSRPPEVVEKIAAKLRGQKRGEYSEEHCEAISTSLKAVYKQRREETGFSYPLETRQRMTAHFRGLPAWNKGQKGMVKSKQTSEELSARAEKTWATRRAKGTDKWSESDTPRQGRQWTPEQRSAKAQEVRARFSDPVERKNLSEKIQAHFAEHPLRPKSDKTKLLGSESLCSVWSTYTPDQRAQRVSKTSEAQAFSRWRRDWVNMAVSCSVQ